MACRSEENHNRTAPILPNPASASSEANSPDRFDPPLSPLPLLRFLTSSQHSASGQMCTHAKSPARSSNPAWGHVSLSSELLGLAQFARPRPVYCRGLPYLSLSNQDNSRTVPFTLGQNALHLYADITLSTTLICPATLNCGRARSRVHPTTKNAASVGAILYFYWSRKTETHLH